MLWKYKKIWEYTSSDLKWEKHIINIVKKANLKPRHSNFCETRAIGLVQKAAFAVLSPYFIKNVTLLEKVRRSATKLPYGVRHHTYQEQLKKLKLVHSKRKKKTRWLSRSIQIIVIRVALYTPCLTFTKMFAYVKIFEAHERIHTQ